MKKHGMKKAASLLLSLIMALSLCFTASPVEVKAATGGKLTVNAGGVDDPGRMKRGDTVTITVSLADNTEAVGTGFKFLYDSDQLEIQKAEQGAAYKEGYASQKTLYWETPGMISSIILNDADVGVEVPPVNGSIFTATFRVKDTAKGAVDIQIQDLDFVNMDYVNVDCEVVNNASAMNVIVPVDAVSLNKSTLDLAKGMTEQLIATVVPADTTSSVAWTSSDANVATVGADGTVTAAGKGTATITASADGKSVSCTVNVTVPLEGIRITGTTSGGVSSDSGLTIKKGTTAALTVAYIPEDAAHSTITWESSDPSKATVESTGVNTAVVRALADTEATPVTITAKAGAITDTFTITVQEVKMTGIEIKNATTIHKGEAETLVITYKPEDTTDDKTASWSSSAPAIATVDGSGKVTAVAPGTADITAAVGNYTATCTVTVDAPLKGIIPAETAIELIKGQSQIITYTLNPSDTTSDKKVTFASDNAAVAEVDPLTGEVTAKAEGTATVTLSGADNVTAAVTVTVTEIPVDAVVINKKNAIVEKGETLELIGTVEPGDTTDDDTTIKWKSSDESVVTVSPATSNSGEAVTVTATDKGGTAVITATAGKNKVAICEIMVPIHMEGITSPAGITMNRKETISLKATPVPENTTDDTAVIWTSSNEAVAKVDPSTGAVTALKEGTAVITAKTTVTMDSEGVPYETSTTVTVNEKHLDEALAETIGFTELKEALLKNQSINMNGQLNLKKVMEENQITDDVKIAWSSSDEAVASIDQSGVATGMGEGKTTITAVITVLNGEGEEIGKYTVSTEMEVKEIPLESIAFNKVITEMQVGATETLSIIYNPENTTDLRDIQWSSSDASVLSVENGKLTALKKGKATITAKVGDKSVSCEIQVKGTQTGGQANAAGTTNGNKPATGDQSNSAFYLVLLLASLAAISFLGIRRSRRVGR